MMIAVVLVALLAGCGSATAPTTAPAANPATPISATLTADSSQLPAASPAPTSNQQLPLPAGWTQVDWEGMRISYAPSLNPNLAVIAPLDGTRASALLVPSCPLGVDCFSAILRLFAGDGADASLWVDRNAPADAHDRKNITIDGQPAISYQVGYATDGLGAPIYYDVVRFGSDILQIERVGGFGEEIPTYLDLDPLPYAGLAAGQQVFGQTELDLWSAAAGGERVAERPKLYAGALVTLLQLTAAAVEVRTPEGVTGWLQQPAAAILGREQPASGAVAGLGVGQPITVINPKGLPLRNEPQSQARKLREQIPQGEQATISAVRGDWLLIALKDGSSGWARWYYDGAQYMK
jgi:hypothetical protein